ncbi:phospholipid carrier-dependent glycosyltransferase [Desulforhopalus vacuolatus]|uniref:phospholipid carrier-dependent glycosyltransferase n=1 Tax=Desulforhopalus vacuolatus TaxID=40414 RepID=UPI0019660490|nr:phospholipid carrier-dependent glycosyltransferase [Desulforhopalus vacuolatus]MBM9519150.1 phospholipid carrier-dependent glycosyltransferase [Desulforhopalus vacuolatus]
MRKLLYFLLPIIFFGTVYILPLGERNLIRPDEMRYAEIPREMLASGQWIVPKLAGARYFEKPPLGYWLGAYSEKYLGENNFAVRLPSAVATGGTAVLLFFLVWRASLRSREKIPRVKMTRKERRAAKLAVKQKMLAEKEAGREILSPPSPLLTGSLAALIYLSCAEVFAIGTTALPDAVFTFFLTGCIISFFAATEARRGSLCEWVLLIFAGLFCAAAFLSKGFPGIALPVLVLVPWLMWQRRFVDLFRMSWLPLLLAFFVTLPWVLQINWWEKDFWNYFIFNEHFRRFIGENAQHGEPFWYFLTGGPLMSFPWVLMIPAAAAGLLQRSQFDPQPGTPLNSEGRLLRFSVLWFLLPLLFFSVSHGKLMSYILPCFVPFAVLMAQGLSRLFSNRERRKLFQGGAAVVSLICLVALGVLLYVQIFGIEGLKHFTGIPGGTPFFVDSARAGLVGAGLTAMLLLLSATRQGLGVGSAFTFGIAPLLLFSVMPWTVPDRMEVSQMPGPLLKSFAHRISPDDIIISGASSLQAVCWYWKRTDVFAVEWAGELDYGFTRKDERLKGEKRILTLADIRRLAKEYPNRIVLVIRSVYSHEWESRLPKPLYQRSSGPEGFTIMRL